MNSSAHARRSLLINGGHEPLDFTMPDVRDKAKGWELLLDTNDDAGQESVAADGKTHLESRSLKLFRRDAGGVAPQPLSAR